MIDVADYRPLARWIASGYFIPGADREDVEAEALLGLAMAYRDFDPARGASFKSFAELCMRRQIITAFKTAGRMKHRPLSESVRHAVNDEGELLDVVDLVADWSADPERQLIAREEALALLKAVAEQLSPFERRVLIAYANGYSYVEIADQLGVATRQRETFDSRYGTTHTQLHPKSIDNALQRARRKLALPPTTRQAA